jgi:hypothetical protein
MEQLNQEFINPYNATNYSLGLEKSVATKLKGGLPSDCNTTREISYYIQERSDYFYNQLFGLKSKYRTECPISAPLIQREHEVMLGILLNRLRMHALRAKSCRESSENKDSFVRSLKKLTENRFGGQGEEIKSCKQNNVTVEGSCIKTGALAAGTGK